MTFQKKLSDEQERQLIQEYTDFVTVHELTIIYRVSERTVYRLLAKYNVKFRHQGKTRRPRRGRKPRPRPPLQPCGTNAAYQRHRRKGEYPCDACLQAHVANVMAYKKRKKNG